MSIRYPEINVRLSGSNGNGFVVVSRVRMAMQRAGIPEDECQEFFEKALSGDYDHLLATCAKTVNVS